MRRGSVTRCQTRTSMPSTVMSPKRSLRSLLRPSSSRRRTVPSVSQRTPSGRALMWMRSGSRTCCQTRTSTSTESLPGVPRSCAPATPAPAEKASASTSAAMIPCPIAAPRFTSRGLLPEGADTLPPFPAAAPPLPGPIRLCRRKGASAGWGAGCHRYLCTNRLNRSRNVSSVPAQAPVWRCGLSRSDAVLNEP